MLRPCLALWSIFVVPALTLLGVHLSGLSFATPLFVLICVPTLELLLGKEQTVQSGGTQTSALMSAAIISYASKTLSKPALPACVSSSRRPVPLLP